MDPELRDDLTGLEARLGERIQASAASVEAGLGERIGATEARLGRRIDRCLDLTAEVQANLENFQREMLDFNREMQAQLGVMAAAVERIEPAVDSLRDRVARLEERP